MSQVSLKAVSFGFIVAIGLFVAPIGLVWAEEDGPNDQPAADQQGPDAQDQGMADQQAPAAEDQGTQAQESAQDQEAPAAANGSGDQTPALVQSSPTSPAQVVTPPNFGALSGGLGVMDKNFVTARSDAR